MDRVCPADLSDCPVPAHPWADRFLDGLIGIPGFQKASDN